MPKEMDLDAQRLFFDCSNHIKPLKCKTCPNFETNFLASLRCHIRSGHQDEKQEEKIYECSRCSMVTFSKYLHVRHSLFDKCAMTLGVREDRTTFSIKEEPTELLQESHDPCTSGISISSRTKSIQTTQSGFGGWHCGQCAFKGKSKSLLTKHIKYHHANPEDIRWFACDECPLKYRRRGYLNKHKLSHIKPEDIHWFKCDHCDLKYKTKLGLKRHINWLKYGAVTSENKKNLRKHRTSVHMKPEDIQWFYCTQCTSKFKAKISLRAHVMFKHLNSGEINWFRCNQCPAKYVHYSSLNSHIIERHTKFEDIHWFTCDQCTGKFKQKGHLNSHIKLRHRKPGDIQRFACALCPSKFKKRGELKVHVKSLHIKPEDIHSFRCELCNYKSIKKDLLWRHAKNCHSKPEDIRWFKCDECSYKSKTKRGLRLHVRRRHGLSLIGPPTPVLYSH